MNPIRVLVVDDHPLMREALRAAIEDEVDMIVAGEASDGEGAVMLAGSLHPNVIIMDLFMPVKDGMETIHEIRGRDPDAHILVLTSSSDEGRVVAAIQAGALGYLLKDAERVEILQGIRQVSQGQVFLPPHMARKLVNGLRQSGVPFITAEADMTISEPPVEALTSREQEVLKLIGQGASNHDIAERLFLSDGTVRTHVHHILDKLNLKNRNQAILYAMKAGLTESPDNSH
jgi:NarL family two-component system response regulator LiaR